MRLASALLTLTFLPVSALAYTGPMSGNAIMRDRPSVRSINEKAVKMEERRKRKAAVRPTIAPSSSAFTIFANSAYKFSVNVPGDWQVSSEQTDVMGAKRIASFIPAKDNGIDGLVLVVEDPAPQTLELYFANAVWWLKQTYDRFLPVSAKTTTMGGQPAYDLTFSAMDEGNALKARQIWTLKDRKIYIVSLWASPETFDQHQKLFDTAVTSFTFLRY